MTFLGRQENSNRDSPWPTKSKQVQRLPAFCRRPSCQSFHRESHFQRPRDSYSASGPPNDLMAGAPACATSGRLTARIPTSPTELPGSAAEVVTAGCSDGAQPGFRIGSRNAACRIDPVKGPLRLRDSPGENLRACGEVYGEAWGRRARTAFEEGRGGGWSWRAQR